jgi:hypothetical protein
LAGRADDDDNDDDDSRFLPLLLRLSDTILRVVVMSRGGDEGEAL